MQVLTGGIPASELPGSFVNLKPKHTFLLTTWAFKQVIPLPTDQTISLKIYWPVDILQVSDHHIEKNLMMKFLLEQWQLINDQKIWRLTFLQSN